MAPRPPPCPAGGLLGDLFAFDPSGSLWTDLTPAGRGTAPPGPRAAHGVAWLDGGLYVHGGYGDGEPSTVFPICLRDSRSGYVGKGTGEAKHLSCRVTADTATVSRAR